MQATGVYGARVSKTHIEGKVEEALVSFRKEGPFRTIIAIFEKSNPASDKMEIKSIIQYAVITPANYEVKASNWMSVTEMMIKTSPSKSIKGSGRFETMTITEKFGANNHALHITNAEGEMTWMVMVTGINRASQNAISKGIIFKNEAFFQGGGDLNNYEAANLRFPVYFNNERLLIRVPSLTKLEYLERFDHGPAAGQELPDQYIEFYIAQFKEPLSITEQFNVHLRGNNGYPLPSDLFKDATEDGIISAGSVGTCETKGFITKTIGETFFYFESHDGSVRATIHKDPLKILMKSIGMLINTRWKDEWDKYARLQTAAPDNAERYYNINMEFVTLVMNAMTDTSKATEAHHIAKFVDFYLEKLA